ncbi:MAG TPA: HAD-IB family hydrolase [Actinomycetota bacterium]|nr:HAD-IB family hydrolase [Actinomycetota bacterium]
MEAAFFDLDKTIIARSSTLAFGKPLMKEGMISKSLIVKSLYAQLVYHLVGADEDKMEKMRVALLALTRGWDRDKIRDLVRETLTEIIDPVIYSEALDLIGEHRRHARRVYIVSSSAEEIVRPLAEYLGVPHCIATRAEVDADGKYTGELEFYCYGENKAVAMREHAERYGIDLQRSYAYSDSVTDVPMLELVGHPHAVNPDRELRAIATERGWEVLEFVRPVSMRSRIMGNVPKPTPAAALVGGTVVAAVLAWAALRRRGDDPVA